MALGGGTFTVQNKVIPGTYINFISAASANSVLSDRGIATIPLELDWGMEGEVFEVRGDEFRSESIKVFGYSYTHDKMRGLRDLFRNCNTLYAYRLNGGGTKAGCVYAEAVCSGIRGNDLKIIIQKNADDNLYYDVKTLLETAVVDEQMVKSAAELIGNGFVTFKTAATLEETASTPLTGGTNGNVDGSSHQGYLDKIESYSFNVMGVVSTVETVKSLYASFTQRMRDDIGVKFQTVIYQKPADYYGVVNVRNKTIDAGWPESSMVYWVTGAIAGCAVNKSCQNKVYDGEFSADTALTQTDLRLAIKAGEFTLHRVGDSVRVLADINSMVTVSETFGEVFKENQTIRVIDQIANDIAVIFTTKYLGVMPNDDAGRISLWSDIVKHHKEMNEIRAIENFIDEDVIVNAGETKKSVVVTDAVTVVNCMDKVYITTTVA